MFSDPVKASAKAKKVFCHDCHLFFDLLLTLPVSRGVNEPLSIIIILISAQGRRVYRSAHITVNNDQSVTQLKLALAWNRADVAKSLIFSEDKKWEVRSAVQVSFAFEFQSE